MVCSLYMCIYDHWDQMAVMDLGVIGRGEEGGGGCWKQLIIVDQPK